MGILTIILFVFMPLLFLWPIYWSGVACNDELRDKKSFKTKDLK